jgi:predicted transcriptional regulator
MKWEGRMKKTAMDKIVEILTEAKQPTLKNRIMQRCGLPSSDFTKYTLHLAACGLLTATPALNLRLKGPSKSRMLYQTTEKGKIFLQKYAELLTLLEISDKYQTIQVT